MDKDIAKVILDWLDNPTEHLSDTNYGVCHNLKLHLCSNTDYLACQEAINWLIDATSYCRPFPVSSLGYLVVALLAPDWPCARHDKWFAHFVPDMCSEKRQADGSYEILGRWEGQNLDVRLHLCQHLARKLRELLKEEEA